MASGQIAKLFSRKMLKYLLMMREAKLMTLARLVVAPIFHALYYPLFWPKFRGRKNFAKVKNQPLIIVGNHISPLDAVTVGILSPRNLHYFAKNDLENGILGKLIFRHLGLILINRDIKSHATHQGEKLLANRMAIAVFPEGTCRAEYKKFNELLPFKVGAAKMAVDTGAAVLPVATCGKYRPGKLKIVVGAPLHFAKNTSVDEANETIRETIFGLMKENGVRDVRKLAGKPAQNPAKNPPIVDENPANNIKKIKSKEAK